MNRSNAKQLNDRRAQKRSLYAGFLGVAFVLSTVLLTHCGGGKSPAAQKKSPTTEIVLSQADKDEALNIYKTRCVTCHGELGKGDGPGSASLDPKPRDFSSEEWQTGINDEDLAKIIKFGGASVGKSPTMPGNPDLIAKENIIRGLVQHIRSLKGK